MAALALLLGLVGGVMLTAAAGARRTDTAYPRLAAGPGWNAAQGRPASVLRTELFRAEDRRRGQPRHTARHGTRERSPRPCTGIIQNRLIGTPLLA